MADPINPTAKTIYHLHVAFRDRPGSLGAVTSALSKNQTNILEASVFVTPDGIGLDMFALEVPHGAQIAFLDSQINKALSLPAASQPPPTAELPMTPAGSSTSVSATANEENKADAPPAAQASISNALAAVGSSEGSAEFPPNRRGTLDELQVEWDQQQFSSLVLHNIIGEGGGSKVWKGGWNGTFVAVKVLKVDPCMGRDALRSFVQEAKMLSQIRHPSICAFIGTCMQQGFPAIVLEYMHGGSLHDLLHNRTHACEGDEETPLPIAARLLSRISLEVATGVAYLHDSGVIHRDVKAANVLLDEKQHAKVTDFGISTNFGVEHTAETGTYRSMAPEVISHQKYDYKCDVYSFGVLLWEIVHQQIPFEEDNALQAAFAVAMEEKRPCINPRPDLETFGELISACWAQSPTTRPDMDLVVRRLIALDAQVGRAGAP